MSVLHQVHPDAPRPGVRHIGTSNMRKVGTLTGFAALAWVAHHIAVIAGFVQYGAVYIIAFTLLFGMTAIPLVLSWFERPFNSVAPPDTRIAVVVPVWNEHEDILHQVLYSLLDQSRRPYMVVVVDDGTHTDEEAAFAQLRQNWTQDAGKHDVRVTWVVQENRKKRHAQSTGFAVCRDAGFGKLPNDIIVTVDSDSVLVYEALEEGVKPFADPGIQSVGGVNIGINSERNFLTRLSDLLHVQWQLVTKSAQNVGGNITVNSGRLALYRAAVCIDNIDVYLQERWLGGRVEYSDDSMLTMYALRRGRAVQQRTAITFTWHPENFSHLRRQRLRWMRGWFIRSFWRFRYLKGDKTSAFVLEAMDMIRLNLGTAVTLMVLVIRPVFLGGSFVWQLFLLPLLISYTTSLCYFSIRRDNQSVGQQIKTYALSPLMLVWCWCILRPMRLYAMLTSYKTEEWNTRSNVETSHGRHQREDELTA